VKRKGFQCFLLSFYTLSLIIELFSNMEFLKHDDPYEQAMVGKSMWTGNGIQLNGKPYIILPPGLSAAVGGVDLVVNELEWSGKFVTLVSFFSSLFLLYHISHFFFKERLFTFISVILFATNSNIIINATNGRSESLFTLIFLVLTYLTLKFSQRERVSIRGILLFSILWAFLYYTRPEGLIVGGILWLWMAWNKRLNLRHHLIILISPLLFLSLIFPYLLFLKEQTGRWQLSGKTYINLVMGELKSPYQTGEKFTMQTNPRYLINDRVADDPFLAKSVQEYWNEPDNDILARIPHNLLHLGTVYWFSFSVVGIGLCIWGAVKLSVHENLFLITAISVVLLYVIFFILPRSVAMYHWVVCVYLAAGLKAWKLFLETRLKGKMETLLIYAPLVLLVVYQMRSVLKTSYLFLFS
jgi:hypothetical protein